MTGRGLKAAQKIQGIITHHNEASAGSQVTIGQVGIVALPEGVLPDTWDLADELPDGWTMDTVKKMIGEAVQRVRVQESKDGKPTKLM